MQALTIVKNFNALEYCNLGFVTIFEVTMVNQFDFQVWEKLSVTTLFRQLPFLPTLA
jgi:hypothetical protein